MKIDVARAVAHGISIVPDDFIIPEHGMEKYEQLRVSSKLPARPFRVGDGTFFTAGQGGCDSK